MPYSTLSPACYQPLCSVLYNIACMSFSLQTEVHRFWTKQQTFNTQKHCTFAPNNLVLFYYSVFYDILCFAFLWLFINCVRCHSGKQTLHKITPGLQTSSDSIMAQSRHNFALSRRVLSKTSPGENSCGFVSEIADYRRMAIEIVHTSPTAAAAAAAARCKRRRMADRHRVAASSKHEGRRCLTPL